MRDVAQPDKKKISGLDSNLREDFRQNLFASQDHQQLDDQQGCF